jgi:beta-lysine 5,6-aminomutase beta subunit
MDEKSFDQTLDLTKIKPYGDTMNDGKVQLSFTLPIPCNDEAVEAAKQLLKKMGLDNPQVIYIFQLLRFSGAHCGYDNNQGRKSRVQRDEYE